MPFITKGRKWGKMITFVCPSMACLDECGASTSHTRRLNVNYNFGAAFRT